MSTQVKALPKLSLLRENDFFKYWAGQTVSMIGSLITGVAIPRLAVIGLNATPAQMGWFGAYNMLPMLLWLFFSPVWGLEKISEQEAAG